MEKCPLGAELLHAEEQTDIRKLITTFCNFCERAQ
jgi:hypothetical protein